MARAKSNDKLYKKLIKDALKLPIGPAKLQKDKIPTADRIQALKRIPQVESDLKVIEKAEREHNFPELHNLKNNFYKKYKLPGYCVSLNIPPSAIQIIRPDSIKYYLRPRLVEPFIPLAQNASQIPIPLSYDAICRILDYHIPSDGKHLTIVIDLCKTQTEIIAELKNIFKEVKTTKKSEARKLRKHDYDIWEVYDKCNQSEFRYSDRGGIKFTKVAMKLFGRNKFTDARRQNVKKAYKKAFGIMKIVMKEIVIS